MSPVSVVIPAYNAGATLDDALRSVAAQRLQPAEVIVADDASTDDTVQIAESWRDRLPLRVLTTDRNCGAGVARRRAIDAAGQTFVANLDADDVWLDDHLETVMPLAGEDRIVATQCRRIRVDGRGGSSLEPASIPPPEDQAKEIVRANFLFSGSIYPRQPLLDPAVGQSERRGVEDWDTWLRLIVLAGCRVVLPPKPTVLKRTLPGAVSVGADYIAADIELYDALLADPRYADWHRVIPRHRRRRVARSRLLEAAKLASAGDSWGARRSFIEAAVTDRSFAGGRQGASSGSVVLRALVGAASPAAFVRLRDRHVLDRGLIIGGG